MTRCSIIHARQMRDRWVLMSYTESIRGKSTADISRVDMDIIHIRVIEYRELCKIIVASLHGVILYKERLSEY